MSVAYLPSRLPGFAINEALFMYRCRGACRAPFSEAKRDIGCYLMDYYNWQRPHQYNGGLSPADAENRPKPLSENS
ncbi:hypothetical protein BST95_00335 [Halioglobus japonicus]|nr:hypothetical protein BST95_00335 [Halioglobus japonicus]GHD21396.1 hypothetical protein GCM10007052_32120 [Halioglobus japonicus]